MPANKVKSLQAYFDSERGNQAALARTMRARYKIKITPQALSAIASGKRIAGPQLAIQIEEATDGAVNRADLRPDIFK